MTDLPPRRPRRHRRLPDYIRLTLYLYPTRNPSYERLVRTYPPAGAQKIYQALLVTGWAQALQEVAGWLMYYSLSSRVPMPIPDLNVDRRPRVRLDLYLRENNADHLAVIESWKSLPPALRQVVGRVALVAGSEAPDIEERIRLLR